MYDERASEICSSYGYIRDTVYRPRGATHKQRELSYTSVGIGDRQADRVQYSAEPAESERLRYVGGGMDGWMDGWGGDGRSWKHDGDRAARRARQTDDDARRGYSNSTPRIAAVRTKRDGRRWDERMHSEERRTITKVVKGIGDRIQYRGAGGAALYM